MQQFNCGLTTTKGREQANHQPALRALIQRRATTQGKAAALRQLPQKPMTDVHRKFPTSNISPEY